jgi:hypothetical protein
MSILGVQDDPICSDGQEETKKLESGGQVQAVLFRKPGTIKLVRKDRYGTYKQV